MPFLLSLFLTGWTSSAFAAYRVYQLKIRHFDTSGKLERIEVTETILDPLQFPAFHGGDGRMKVEMVDTWYCPGDTSRRSFCAKPKKTKRGLASSPIDDKRAPLPFNRQPVIP